MNEAKIAFINLARLDLSKFAVNQRPQHISIAEWVEMNRVKEAEFNWVEQQPVIGSPSLRRLRAAFSGAGFQDVCLKLHPDRDTLDFCVRVTPQVGVANSEELLRLWIRLLRHSGFRIGFCEVAITEVDASTVHGTTMTDDMDRLLDQGPLFVDEDDNR